LKRADRRILQDRQIAQALTQPWTRSSECRELPDIANDDVRLGKFVAHFVP
jgi:hypothetical protein